MQDDESGGGPLDSSGAGENDQEPGDPGVNAHQGAAASGRAFTPEIGTVGGTGADAVIGGHRVAGLIRATPRFLPGQSAGGPLVSLAGQVIGIDLAGAPDGASYAVPIDEALAVARQLAR